MPIRQRYKDDQREYGHLQIDYKGSNGKRIRKTVKPFPLSNWIGLPCIYFLMNGKECVYVGKTINLPCRLQNHLKDKGKIFDGIYYLEVSENDINEIERDIINSIKPEQNRQCKK